MAMLGVLAVAAPRSSHPLLLSNASHSVPTGLYGVVPRAPAKGELAVIRLAGPVQALAVERGYLGAGALVIKPVAALSDDVVCRHGATVTVNGLPMARARDADGFGRPLPRWSGCVTLAAGEVFVLSTVPDSFDSRYFGAVVAQHIVGTGWAIWTSENAVRPAPVGSVGWSQGTKS
jgi:conjugative transfer signal peptidase TraF